MHDHNPAPGIQLRGRVLFCALALIFFLLSSAQVSAETDNSYRDSLIETARQKQLGAERYWAILMHYKPRHGGQESLVDDPKFFLARKGKNDPEAELEATIQAFFQPAALGDDHPACRFRGRYEWLRQELAIDEKKLPEIRCAKFDDAMTLIDPQSAVLIFPATHNNSPTSMFGHTLIRVNNRAKNDLLSFAVNYAAVPDEAVGFFYAVKGIFGLYPGYFSILPYYEKVKEYSSLEHRDMWEYRLNLTPEETRRMVLHIWEMQNIYSDYYFFDENCSYDLLFLLEAARPSVRLTDAVGEGVRFWVIPSDTIRVMREAGMIDGVFYRPSQATKITAISNRINSEHRELARTIGLGKTGPETVSAAVMSDEDRMRTLDLAAEYLQFRASKHELTENDYLKRFMAVLQARSRLGQAQEELYAIPQPVRPDDGHLAAKVSLGGGCRTGSCFGEAAWRAAYHDLMDNDAGYIAGSQINFTQIKARYYTDHEEEAARLESFRLIDIVSLAPWNNFFRPTSWKVATGLEQRLLPGDRDRLVGFVNGGAGITGQLGSALLYCTADGELDAGPSFDHYFAVAGGGTAGMLATIAEPWKINITVKGLSPVAGDIYRSVRAEALQNFSLGRNSSLSLSVSREKTSGTYRSEATMEWNYYY